MTFWLSYFSPAFRLPISDRDYREIETAITSSTSGLRNVFKAARIRLLRVDARDPASLPIRLEPEAIGRNVNDRCLHTEMTLLTFQSVIRISK